jgi:hypothetical protein
MAKHEKVAQHEMLDSSGQPTTDMGDAVGYRYSLVNGGGKALTWQWSDATEDEKRMFALFGAKTLATNTTSGARNNTKGQASPDEQIEKAIERFSQIRDGTWRKPGEGGFKVNLEFMAQAIAKARLELGKPVDNVEVYLQRLTEEQGYLAKVRVVPQVAAHYAKLAGRSTATIDATD